MCDSCLNMPEKRSFIMFLLAETNESIYSNWVRIRIFWTISIVKVKNHSPPKRSSPCKISFHPNALAGRLWDKTWVEFGHPGRYGTKERTPWLSIIFINDDVIKTHDRCLWLVCLPKPFSAAKIINKYEKIIAIHFN